MKWHEFPRLAASDVVAGASVAMVLIPQSLAYAELAGLPPYVGLFASALPLLAFSLLASSPFLQTGPVAVTSLLTFAALPDVAPEELPRLAALLALLVGVFRFILGASRAGHVVRLMSSPVVMGFTSGAAIVILSSQLPKALGVDAPDGGVLWRAGWALGHPGQWTSGALVLSVMTLALFVGGRKLHPLFPGVLIAVVAGTWISRSSGYDGAVVGDIPEGLPPIAFDLPWSEAPTLMLGALVIALVGFAEPASIARTFANETGQRWSANRELVASGVANMVGGISGAYPVGGSFSRSSVNRLAGAQTRWSGGITGLIVLAFLPFANVLAPLPTAVLGAIVLGAAVTLVKPVRLFRLRERSKTQAVLAWATFVATLAFTPRVEWAVLLGIGLTVGLHFVRKFSMAHSKTADGSVVVQPIGMMWMATDRRFEEGLREAAASTNGSVTVDFGRTPFLEDRAVDAMSSVAQELAADGKQLAWENEPAGADELLSGVHPENGD